MSKISNSIKIYGKITNLFTGEEVNNALVQIGVQKTSTDDRGNYALYYIVSEDNLRDKPVEVVVIAENYATYTDEFNVYSDPINYDITLTYVTPIIPESYFENRVCKSLILDYQGYKDIKTVNAYFYYMKEHRPEYKELRIKMNFHKVKSSISAYYICDVPYFIDYDWTLPPKDLFYYIEAEDNEGHIIKKRFPK